MNEVSGQIWTFFEDVSRRRGLSIEELAAGLPLPLAELRRARRFDWELAAEMYDRLERKIGAAAIESEAADGVLERPTTEPLRRVAGWLLSPRLLYDFATRLIPPFAFGPALVMDTSRLGRDKLSVEARIPHEFRECRGLMHAIRGGLVAMPRLLGLPPARVDGEPHPRHSRWVLALPRARWRERLARARSAVSPFDELVRQRTALAGAEIAEAQATTAAARLLRTVIDGIGEVVLIFSDDGRLRFASQALARVLGLPAEGITATSFIDHLHPEDRERVRGGLVVPCPKSVLEVRLRTADGDYRQLEMSARDLRDDPVVAGVLVHGRDVTDKRRTEAALREKEREYFALVRKLSGMAYRARRDSGRLELVSDGAEALLGYAVDELRELDMRELIHPDDLADLRARRVPALEARRASVEEYRIRTRAGEWRWVVDTAHGVFDDAGALVGAEGFLSDITARRRLEEQLAHAQRLEGLGRLAGGVAHDFNNLLGAMLGYTALVRRDLPAGTPAAEDLDSLEDTVRRAAALTGKMLAVARRQIIRPRVLDPNELVLGMDKLLRRTLGADIELSTVTARGAWSVEADPGQLEQVLLNLAVNARDAMPDGGSLTVETHNVVVDGEVPVAARGPHVLIAVADTGTGMSDAVKRHIFEPFFTTKQNGTGLGLATAFGVVTQARGRITVDSEVGQGTTVRIYLPRSEKRVERAAAPPEPLAAAAGETVLLVEDHALLRNVAMRALAEAGYRVVAAANGEEALAMAERTATIDILVTDMVMPGMPGGVLAERMAALSPGLPVLFMSGYTDTPAAPDTHFLAKPFTPASLAAKVREVLDRRPAGR